jgi:hypothetical protein
MTLGAPLWIGHPLIQPKPIQFQFRYQDEDFDSDAMLMPFAMCGIEKRRSLRHCYCPRELQRTQVMLEHLETHRSLVKSDIGWATLTGGNMRAYNL